MASSTNDSLSRVLTLVFTDLADSTALKMERGDRVSGDLIARHREHVTQLAERCDGRIIDWAGDGCFLTFETSSGAVTFALRLQQIHHYESDLPGVRVGMHMGEVTEKPGPGDAPRIEGLTVDLSARVSGLAQPGQVLLSSAVHQSAQQRIGIHEFGQPVRWETYGPYTLKGFDEAMDVREAGLEGLSPFTKPEASEKAWPSDQGKEGSNPDAPIRKIAVLPLTNLSGDPAQEYFSDGMTEAIITELAKIKALRVISRTSVMRYKNTTKPMTEIARELNVDGLIEGSVLRADNQVRITAQFIHGSSDEHLWAEHYDGTLDNILTLQKEVALAIADEIQVAVSPDERMQLRTATRIDPEAHDLYLKASLFGGDWSRESIRRTLEQARTVHRQAPDFGRAYTLEALAWYVLGTNGYASSLRSFAASRKAVRRALRLDSTDGGAHTMSGWLAMTYEWDWDEALHYMNHGIELDSSNHFSYSGLSFLSLISGRYEDAMEAVLKGLEISPNSPPARHNVSLVHFLSGDCEAALRTVDENLKLTRNVLPPIIDGALFAAVVGEHDLARRYIASALELGGPQPHLLAFKGYAHARAGEIEEAEKVLRDLFSHSDDTQILHSDITLLNIGLGRIEDALDALECAHRDHEYQILFMGTSPLYDPLREEPRFQAMIEEMDFPEPPSAND